MSTENEPQPARLPLEPDERAPVPRRSPELGKRARFTVSTSITHQVPEYEARRPEQSRFSQDLESFDEHYERRLKAGEQWMALDLSTLSGKCSLLHLLNKTPVSGVPRFGPRGPIPQAEQDWKILIVGLCVGEDADGKEIVQEFCSLAPGQDLPISPMGVEHYRVRAEEGECKFNLFAIPL